MTTNQTQAQEVYLTTNDNIQERLLGTLRSQSINQECDSYNCLAGPTINVPTNTTVKLSVFVANAFTVDGRVKFRLPGEDHDTLIEGYVSEHSLDYSSGTMLGSATITIEYADISQQEPQDDALRRFIEVLTRPQRETTRHPSYPEYLQEFPPLEEPEPQPKEALPRPNLEYNEDLI